VPPPPAPVIADAFVAFRHNLFRRLSPKAPSTRPSSFATALERGEAGAGSARRVSAPHSYGVTALMDRGANLVVMAPGFASDPEKFELTVFSRIAFRLARSLCLYGGVLFARPLAAAAFAGALNVC
jgi:hypothetical protein